MRGSWLARVGVVATAAVLALGPGGAAWADMVININPGNVPTTAAAFSNPPVCDPNQGGGPIPGKDIWVFNLPGNQETSGDFLSVTASFQGQAPVTITRAGNPSNFTPLDSPGTSKAWIVTDAGWTLTGATAVISGNADFFVLTHTCWTTATPSPSETPGPSGSATPKPSGGAATGGGNNQDSGALALGIGALAVAGAAGVGLVVARRRRSVA